MCLPMQTRVQFFKEILRNEKTDVECQVLPFERDQATDFLQKSAYWERKLGKEHLPTISTADLLLLFSKMWVAKRFGATAGLSVVFGIDNLPWMPTWCNAAALFSSCDVVLVRRLEASTDDVDSAVAFGVDPSSFMRNFKAVRVESANLVTFNGEVLFGASIGEDRPKCCSPKATSTLYLVAPLEGLPGLSSTAVRRAIAVLAQHGYTQPTLATTLVGHYGKGKVTLDNILEKSRATTAVSQQVSATASVKTM